MLTLLYLKNKNVNFIYEIDKIKYYIVIKKITQSNFEIHYNY